jgi:two-component system, sensor histidine kinase and response regulator
MHFQFDSECTSRREAVRVLVVDDDPFNRGTTEELLEYLGYETKAVGDGRAAVAAVAEESFALVLMDIQMPVMDGFQAIALIRAREERGQRRLPAIAMSGHGTDDYRERALAAGFDEFLVKPIDLPELGRAIAAKLASTA